jgi:predicted O-linked N-acetylglucosamine transferase (SPINDLY family)
MLCGETYASRFGSGVLVPLGMEHLVAHSREDYVRRAVALAGDLDQLTTLRQELRGRMANSLLLDFPGFARDVEAAYREMWIRWCAQA